MNFNDRFIASAQEWRAFEIDESLNQITSTIIDSDIKLIPFITEDRFINEILPILECPWKPGALEKYLTYVKEYTNKLRVYSNTNPPELLFIVPEIYPRPETSLIVDSSIASIPQVMDHLHREASKLGNARQYEEIALEYLTKSSFHKGLDKRVIYPIAGILAHYGKVFKTVEGEPLYQLENQPDTNSKPNVQSDDTDESLFTYDYED